MKENVIIGKLIPAGTGIHKYNDIQITYEGMDEEDEGIEKKSHGNVEEREGVDDPEKILDNI